MGMFDNMFEDKEFREKFDKIINNYTGDAFCQLYKYCKMFARDIDGKQYVNLKTLYYYIVANFDDVTLDDGFDSKLGDIDELIESGN